MKKKSSPTLYQSNKTTKADIDLIKEVLDYMQKVIAEGKDSYNLEKRYALSANLALLGEILNPDNWRGKGQLPGVPHNTLYDIRNGLIHYFEQVRGNDVWGLATLITPVLAETVTKIIDGKEKDIGRYDAENLEQKIESTDFYYYICDQFVTVEEKGNTQTKSRIRQEAYRMGPEGKKAEPNLHYMHEALSDIEALVKDVSEDDFLDNPAFETKRYAVEWAVTLMGECAANINAFSGFSKYNPLQHMGKDSPAREQDRIERTWSDLGGIRNTLAHGFGIQGSTLWELITECPAIKDRIEVIMDGHNYPIPKRKEATVTEEKTVVSTQLQSAESKAPPQQWQARISQEKGDTAEEVGKPITPATTVVEEIIKTGGAAKPRAEQFTNNDASPRLAL